MAAIKHLEKSTPKVGILFLALAALLLLIAASFELFVSARVAVWARGDGAALHAGSTAGTYRLIGLITLFASFAIGTLSALAASRTRFSLIVSIGLSIAYFALCCGVGAEIIQPLGVGASLASVGSADIVIFGLTFSCVPCLLTGWVLCAPPDIRAGTVGRRPANSLGRLGARSSTGGSASDARAHGEPATTHSSVAKYGFIGLVALATSAAIGGVGGAIGGIAGGVIGTVVGLIGPLAIDEILKRRASRISAWAQWRATGDPIHLASGPDDPGYVGLLKPSAGTIPFAGRADELKRLSEWIQDPESHPALLITGVGGSGKTRLAIQFAGRLEEDGWLCRFVRQGMEAVAVDNARRLGGRSRVLLIVDYAESRNDLGELLAGVGAERGRIRTLWLARSPGEWLLEAGAMGLQKSSIKLDVRLSPGQDDGRCIRDAFELFSERLGVPEAPEFGFHLPVEPSPILTLHAAALLAVLESSKQPRPVRVEDATQSLLEHEFRYWRQTAQRLGLPFADMTMLRRSIAVACLIPMIDEDGAAAALRRVPELSGPNEELRRRVARWLRSLYPSDLAWMGSFQPDRFAELHTIAELSRSAEFAEACLSELSDREVTQSLTLLARAAISSGEAETLLFGALRRNPTWQEEAVEVAVRTNQRISRLIADAMRESPPGVDSLARISRNRFAVAELNLPAEQAATRLKAIGSR